MHPGDGLGVSSRAGSPPAGRPAPGAAAAAPRESATLRCYSFRFFFPMQKRDSGCGAGKGLNSQELAGQQLRTRPAEPPRRWREQPGTVPAQPGADAPRARASRTRPRSIETGRASQPQGDICSLHLSAQGRVLPALGHPRGGGRSPRSPAGARWVRRVCTITLGLGFFCGLGL